MPEDPLFIAVEIVSKDEAHSELLEKLEDYAWGVPHIWVIDPRRRKLEVFDNSGLHTVEAFELPEQNFRVTLDELLEAGAATIVGSNAHSSTRSP